MPIKTYYTPINRWSSWSVVQLKSENTWKLKDDGCWRYKPIGMVCLRYCNILLTAYQCVSNGLCMNLLILWTEKERSGLVKAKYCKLPTTCLYRYGFEYGVPLVVVNRHVVDI
jgi:hypothetical protein